jgi:hypothetical protein
MRKLRNGIDEELLVLKIFFSPLKFFHKVSDT